MKIISLILLILLTGCQTTVPVIAKFPDPPTDLIAPSKLTPIDPNTTELSTLLDNAAINHGAYYELKANYEAWLEWYPKQKKIFEEIK